MLVATSSRVVLVPLAFAVSLVALRCMIWKITAFLAGRATTLCSVFGVARAALWANANFFTHSRNHGWSRGY